MSQRGSGLARRLALLLLVAGLVGAAQAASAKRASQDFGDLPGWVQEAYARQGDDRGAGLVWLHRAMEIEPLVEEGVRIRERFALRVTHESGLDDAEFFGATYEQGDGVPRISAWTIDQQKQARRPDVRMDFDDLPAIQSFSIYEDTRYRSVSPPMVTVGSVVAVEIERVVARDWGHWTRYFGRRSAPTLYERFSLGVPEGWSFDVSTGRAGALSVARSDSGVVIEGRDLAPLSRREREAPSFEVMPLVEVHWWDPGGSRGFRSWDEVARAMHALSEPVLAEASQASSRGAELAPRGGESLLASLERAFEVAARDVRYVSVQVGIGGYRPYPPDQVLGKSYGDCKGKTFLLRALTRAWGVQSYPVLVRTRSLGPLSEETPGPGHFNHMIAALRLPDDLENPPWASMEIEGIGRLLFVDATASARDVLDLPNQDQGTRALLVLPEGGKLVDLPVRPAHEARVERHVDAELSASGEWIRARVSETWSAAAAPALRYRMRDLSLEERERWLVERASSTFPNAIAGAFELRGLENEAGPLELSYALEGTRPVKKVAGKLIVEPGAIARGVLGRDLPRKLPEGCDYRPGTTRAELVRVSIALPEGLAPESLPAPQSVESEELAFEATWRFEEGVLSYERQAALKTLEVSGERYPEFRKRARSLSKADRRAIMITRQ